MPCIVGRNQTALVQRDDQHTDLSSDAHGHNIFYVKVLLSYAGFLAKIIQREPYKNC